MSRLRLENVEWKEFKVRDVFEIFTGAIVNKKSLKNGDIPRITATDNNNGIALFTEKLMQKNFRVYKNFISISFLGSVFYQKEEVSLDMKIHGIKPKHTMLNREIALFLIPLIKNFTFKYRYGYQLSTSILRNQKLMLPIDFQDNPNWRFMEDYIKQEQKIQAQKIIDYYESRMIKSRVDLLSLDEVEYKEFYLTDIFAIKRGNQNNMAACKEGNIPLVSARKIDNGYKAFISNNGKDMFEENILTLNNDGDGGVGIAFYQPCCMALDTHVTALIPKQLIDKYSLLFVSRVITSQREKFSHGYSINNKRLKKQKILLPVDEKGNPNYEYMRVFMQRLEKEKLSKALEYIRSEYNIL